MTYPVISSQLVESGFLWNIIWKKTFFSEFSNHSDDFLVQLLCIWFLRNLTLTLYLLSDVLYNSKNMAAVYSGIPFGITRSFIPNVVSIAFTVESCYRNKPMVRLFFWSQKLTFLMTSFQFSTRPTKSLTAEKMKYLRWFIQMQLGDSGFFDSEQFI